MIKIRHILAKSTDDPENPRHEETLVGHTEAVVESAQAIMRILKQTDMPNFLSGNWKRFERLLLISAVFHDLGKATNVFQGMLLKHPDYRKKSHPVRHEILSALLISEMSSPVSQFVKQALSDTEIWFTSWIIGGHHLALHKDKTFSKETDKLIRCNNIPKSFVFLGSHPDVADIFSMLSSMNQEQYLIPQMGDIEIPVEEPDDLDAEYLGSIVDRYLNESEKTAKELHPDEKKLLAFAKAVLISADVTGSALTKEKENPSSWIQKHLDVKLSDSHLQKIIDFRLEGNSLRPFQKKIAESQYPVTITIAGCGNGKTIAAYEWAKTHAKGKKLYFCYPTTGTASSGFEDYLLAQTELERALIHSRSQVDIERMLSCEYDGFFEENQRLLSLQSWSKQVIACTVDTVLGLIQNYRSALFNFPVFLNSAFVFDEIHSYDEKLFGAFLIFLKLFIHSPVLIMSATIPDYRLEALKECLGERMGTPVAGESEFEDAKKYCLIWTQDKNDCWNEVRQTLESKENKVLWVCNTVNDAIQIYDDSGRYGLPVKPILYHSRFRYGDRVKIQKNVIHSFNKSEKPAFVICTQVCEMSLNISSDLMISSLAPFSALIQRLGRLNRQAKIEEGRETRCCRCFIYDFICDNGKPYDKDELEESRKALQQIIGKPCSQKMLAEILSEIQRQEDTVKYSAWLDGIWESDQRPLRSGNSTITVILKKDIDKIKKELELKKQKPCFQTLAFWTVPILYRPEITFAEKFGGLPVMDEIYLEYDEKGEKGARWKKEKWAMY